MLDPKNVVMITGGLTADPEVIDGKNGKIIKFRLAVSNAGVDSGKYGESGYFDAVFYEDAKNSNSKFVVAQVSEGKMAKGSQLSVVARLMHERWIRDEVKGQKTTLVIEAVSYAGSAPKEGANAVTTGASNLASATDDW